MNVNMKWDEMLARRIYRFPFPIFPRGASNLERQSSQLNIEQQQVAQLLLFFFILFHSSILIFNLRLFFILQIYMLFFFPPLCCCWLCLVKCLKIISSVWKKGGWIMSKNLQREKRAHKQVGGDEIIAFSL